MNNLKDSKKDYLTSKLYKYLNENIDKWIEYLSNNVTGTSQKRLSNSSIKKYKTAVKKFMDYLCTTSFIFEEELNKEAVLAYKKYLLSLKDSGKLKIPTINLNINGLNSFLDFLNLSGFRLKTENLKGNTTLDNMIDDLDYLKLIEAADKFQDEEIKLIMQTLTETGIRIGELKYFTVEAVSNNYKIPVTNKGKTRDIIIPDRIKNSLLDYIKENEINHGYIFRAKRNKEKPVNEMYVWRKLQKLAEVAGIDKEKVHSHSFRHLFAKRYLGLPNANILTLANLLGHSSLETTRLYTRETSSELLKLLNSLSLI